MTVVQTLVLAVATAAAGFVAGGVVVPRLSHGLGRRAARRQAERSGPTVSEVLDLIVIASKSGIAVVDQFRDVVLHNPRAEELGLVHERQLVEHAWAAAERVLMGDAEVEFDLRSSADRRLGRSTLSVRGQARLLSEDDSRFVVLFADDESEQVRMEATRRDFVANVSHELKTPVGAMALLAEALLESADEPEVVRHFGERVLHESNRLGSMVSELIALSRLQGAEKLPELEPVSVDEIIDEALGRAKIAAEHAEIAVAADEPSGLWVLGDATLLVTALTNLISNAINYSPEGSPVSVSRGLRDGHVRISVADHGIGIAPEHQERVFERFFRVDKARSRETGGTGLGLAIVKHVAANHNGAIRLWSKPGVGSTFTVELPSAPAKAGLKAPEKKPEAARVRAGDAGLDGREDGRR